MHDLTTARPSLLKMAFRFYLILLLTATQNYEWPRNFSYLCTIKWRWHSQNAMLVQCVRLKAMQAQNHHCSSWTSVEQTFVRQEVTDKLDRSVEEARLQTMVRRIGHQSSQTLQRANKPKLLYFTKVEKQKLEHKEWKKMRAVGMQGYPNVGKCRKHKCNVNVVHLYSATCIASEALLLIIYIALLPMGAHGSAGWVSNTTCYDCCHYCHYAGTQPIRPTCMPSTMD